MNSDATAQLLALICSVFYASALVSARAGMRYSTPTTVTLVSILMQNLLLWSAIFVTGGVHAVPLAGVLLFTLVGIFQLAVRLLAYTGVEKIGASRSSALQSVSPLISAAIAITISRRANDTADYPRHIVSRGWHRFDLVETRAAVCRTFAPGTCCCRSAPHFSPASTIRYGATF